MILIIFRLKSIQSKNPTTIVTNVFEVCANIETILQVHEYILILYRIFRLSSQYIFAHTFVNFF